MALAQINSRTARTFARDRFRAEGHDPPGRGRRTSGRWAVLWGFSVCLVGGFRATLGCLSCSAVGMEGYGIYVGETRRILLSFCHCTAFLCAVSVHHRVGEELQVLPHHQVTEPALPARGWEGNPHWSLRVSIPLCLACFVEKGLNHLERDSSFTLYHLHASSVLKDSQVLPETNFGPRVDLLNELGERVLAHGRWQ